MRKLLLLSFGIFLMTAVPARAQAACTLGTTAADVDNPGSVQFCPSLDHSLIDSYELDILRPDGTVLQTINLGKPTISTVDGSCTAAINVQPIAFASGYSTRVRAKAGTATSASAVSINKFNRVPGGPSKVTNK